MMKNTLFASIKFLLFSTVLFGGLYTLLVTGVGQVFFAHQANGSQIVEGGEVKGSEPLAQPLTKQVTSKAVIKLFHNCRPMIRPKKDCS